MHREWKKRTEKYREKGNNMTNETTLSEIYEMREFEQVKDYLIGGGTELFQGEKKGVSLKKLQEKQPTWNCGDILFGLERLQQVAKESEKYVYHVYSQEEREKNSELKDVILIHMPAKEQTSDTPVILMAGGAYGAVCTMVEALPVAARLNELGYSCFCLNYRVAGQVDLKRGLMPKPLDDLASAWKLIKKQEKYFEVDAEHYIVGGFSAGGHIAALWGTDKKGYSAYHIPKPVLLMLAYPLISLETIDEPMQNMMNTGLFGVGHTEQTRRYYDAADQVSDAYPMTYLIQSEDDDTVPIINAKRMEAALEKNKIRKTIEVLSKGGHGFGLGSVTPGAGWVERAMQMCGGGKDEDI